MGEASRDGSEEAQQRDEPIGLRAKEAIEQGCRHSIVLDRRHEGGTRRLPERRCREHVAPPTAPALNRAAIDANDLSEPLQSGCCDAVLQHRNQHHDRGEVDAASEKAQRRRRLALAASVHVAAEAEALIVLGAEPARTPARLAPVSRRMPGPAAQLASRGLAGRCQIAVDGEQEIVESGIRQQSCVQDRHLVRKVLDRDGQARTQRSLPLRQRQEVQKVLLDE